MTVHGKQDDDDGPAEDREKKSSTYLSNILDEFDQQVVAGGPLVAAVQTIGITIHCHFPRLRARYSSLSL